MQPPLNALSTTLDAKIYPYGDSAIVLESRSGTDPFDQEILQRQRYIWSLAEALRQLPVSKQLHIVDIVPGNQNLTLVFDPLHTDIEFAINTLTSLWQSVISKPQSERPTPVVDLPVRYGGEYGPDLKRVADSHQLTVDQLIQKHCKPVYTVLFLGFQPGFPYLFGLNPELQTPRLAQPRQSVAAGSVGIGGNQTGIYPFSSPGGWQLIGRYCGEQRLFDQNRRQSCLLDAGTRVRFVAVN